MSIAHLLDDFGSYLKGAPLSLTDISLEDLKLEAFERGYKAGWDDAAQAAEEDTRRISAEFAQTLQDLSFTYEEARIAALGSLRPLLDQIVASVLPALAKDTIGLHVAEQLQALADAQSGGAVDVVTAPRNIPALETMLDDMDQPEVRLRAEESLADGQVYLSFGAEEREIDLSGVLSGINQAIDAYFNELQRESA